MLREWLKLLRIHTACLTMASVAIALLLAGTSPASRHFIRWMAVALLYHASGFLLNNLMDYPADRRDPAKAHFPLVSGSISTWDATWGCFLLYGACYAGGIFVAPAGVSFYTFVLALAAGMIYNVLSKESLWATWYITVAFIALPLSAFMSANGHLDTTAGLYFGYLGLQLVFQIAVEGYLKDFRSDPASLPRAMGLRLVLDKCDGKHYFTGGGMFLVMAALVNLAQGFVLLALAHGPWTWLLAVACTVWWCRAVADFVFGPYNNVWIVKLSSAVEISKYLALVFVLHPGWATIALAVGPVAWFLAWNQATWGAWRPRV